MPRRARELKPAPSPLRERGMKLRVPTWDQPPKIADRARALCPCTDFLRSEPAKDHTDLCTILYEAKSQHRGNHLWCRKTRTRGCLEKLKSDESDRHHTTARSGGSGKTERPGRPGGPAQVEMSERPDRPGRLGAVGLERQKEQEDRPGRPRWTDGKTRTTKILSHTKVYKPTRCGKTEREFLL